MALGFQLDLRQSQQLVMTPQLQQAIKLLQMSNLELREYVEHELESNPLIRVEEEADTQVGMPPETLPELQSGTTPDADETPLDARLTPEGDHSLAAETFDTGAENLYDSNSGEGGAATRAGVGAGGNQSFDAPSFDLEQQPDRPESLRAHLLAQLGQGRADPQVLLLARLLVEELDETGYLRTSLAELVARLGAALEQMEAALALVQDCEPTGVGARSLAECLALQLAERDRLDPAMRRAGRASAATGALRRRRRGLHRHAGGTEGARPTPLRRVPGRAGRNPDPGRVSAPHRLGRLGGGAEHRNPAPGAGR
jgi:RNA polymerase sigma-54 factor